MYIKITKRSKNRKKWSKTHGIFKAIASQEFLQCILSALFNITAIKHIFQIHLYYSMTKEKLYLFSRYIICSSKFFVNIFYIIGSRYAIGWKLLSVFYHFYQFSLVIFISVYFHPASDCSELDIVFFYVAPSLANKSCK